MVCRILITLVLLNIGYSYSQYAGEFYRDNQDARSAAMGGLGNSTGDGRNPANLAFVKERIINLSYKNKYSGLANVSFFSYIRPGYSFPLLVSLATRQVPGIPDTRAAWTDDNDDLIPGSGEINYSVITEFSQQEIGIILASVLKIKNQTVGWSVKPYFSQLGEYRAWGISGDVATVFTPYDQVKFGTRIEDIIGVKRWDTGTIEIPAPLILVGGQLQLSTLTIGAEGGIYLTEKSTLNYHLGLEYKKHEQLHLRGGISHDRLLSFGAGFSFEFIQVDYAFLHPPIDTPFKASHLVSTKFFLEKLNQIRGKITP